jgi:OmcA/MtrC family decaheme c-type cytochrome
VVTFRLFKDAAYTQDAGTCAGGGSSAFTDAFTPNFTVSKLVDDTTTPGTKRWQSYINVLVNTTKVAAVEGSRGKLAGTLKDNGDGSCTYTFASDLSKSATATTTAGVTEPYDPAAVMRIGMQNNPTTVDTTHPTFDGWTDLAAGGAQIQPGNARAIVDTAACNQCHSDISHHGGKRHSTEYCVTCHNAGTPDPNPKSVNSTSLDFAIMIHKIHQGGDLPSVTGTQLDGTPIPGATPGTIVINGDDFTFVGFPQNTGNCKVCHSLTSGTGSDYWSTQASIEACTACHDRTSFGGATPPGFLLHKGGAVPDGSCAPCHGSAANAPFPVTKVHPLLAPTATTQAAVLKITNVTGGAPGSKPVVTFSVTNPANNNAPMDVTTDPLWANAGRRLVIDIGWTLKPGEDWTNTGSGAIAGFGSIVAGPAPGQPTSFDVLAGLVATPATVVKNADGTYTASLPTTIPADAVGSGVAVLEGHLDNAPGATAIRTDTMFFAITDSSASSRRTVVDIDKCNKCHGMLQAHGANRNDNINACVVCHNTEATDVTQRKSGSKGIDNKSEQAIHFAAMIHGLHSGTNPPFTQGLVVYGFTGSPLGAGPEAPNDFRDVQFPEGNSVGRCVVCHADSNPYPSADIGVVNGLTISTGGSPPNVDPGTYLRTTPVAGVCSSCHQSAQATAHMSQMGAVGFATVGTSVIVAPGLTQDKIDTAAQQGGPGAETCTICHGKGALADPILFHGL